ncbi:hypothetical protein Y032_0013g2096 [Ancylostoma ceylanicum]|uniref:Uncharacterized protein n=2 Tax=Ancylostoma ceylanicum TaxID=53326 RepID=A0A016VBD8_9BILA|nr:hypothetical protein Y032_0013g2096 [Ancylostoma ceylanicum]
MELDEDISYAQVMRTDAYLASLQVPKFRCDRTDKEQLKIHLLCSMLCCPRQIEEDETVSAEKVNKNMWWLTSFVFLRRVLPDVSRNFLNLYTVGRIATNDDRAESERIYKNLESVFQLPLFENVVEMDGQAKFRPLPPACIKSLYNRILLGGQNMRRREGINKSKKEQECHTPEAVYKAKVVCNFLLELIEKERNHQQSYMVEWQSVQRRYQAMFTDEKDGDKELMETYKSKYGLEFIHPSLNSEVVKNWTGRSTITKALSMPIFHKIYWETEEGTGMLHVGFKDNIMLYDEEELARDAAAIEAARVEKEQRSVKVERKRSEPEKVVKPNELEHVTPLRQRQAPQVPLPVLPDVVSSPFASLSKPQQAENTAANSIEVNAAMKYTQQRAYNMNEPQYIPTSGNVESSDSDSLSEDTVSEDGVYTDEEELEANASSNIATNTSASADLLQNPQQPAIPTKNIPSAGFAQSSQQLTTDLPKPEASLIIPKPLPVPVRSYQVPLAEEPMPVDGTLKPFRNPWEVMDDGDESANQLKSPILHALPQASQRGPTNNNVLTATVSQSAEAFNPPPRHISAFSMCKNALDTSKRESEVDKLGERRYTSLNEINGQQMSRSYIYDRKENMSNPQDFERGRTSEPCFSGTRPVTEHSHPSATNRQLYNGIPASTSVFSRPISETAVRARNSVRPQGSSQQSPAGLGNSTYSGECPRSGFTTGQPPSCPKSLPCNGEATHGQRSQSPLPQGDLYTSRPRVFAPVNYDTAARDVNHRLSVGNQPTQGTYRNEAPGSNYSQPPFGGFNKERTLPSFGNEKCNHNNIVTTQHLQSQDSCQNKSIGQNDIYRSHNISRNTNNTSRLPPSRIHDPLDSYRNRSRMSVRPDSTASAAFSQGGENSKSPIKSLTPDQEARLRMIRDFTFLHRNVKDLGFRCVGDIRREQHP